MDMDNDEFEEEMEAELATRIKKATEAATSGSFGATSGNVAKLYENIYFDSDEEQDPNPEQGETTARHRILSNDELLYDPDQDDEDQSYVDDVRRKYVPAAKRKLSEQKVKGLPHSDAVLNCPACFVVVCLDCQRHERYQNQYRAMFVTNCSVDKSQKLKFPLNKKGKGKKAAATSGDEEDFHPVKCDQCSTEIGVFDQEEVYHFFNIVASHS